MRTNCLNHLNDINLDLLPQVIRDEFEKIKFKFDINYLGVYLRQNLFAKVYVHYEFVWNEELLNERVKFNENVKNSIDEYDDGFHDAFYDVDFLQYIENENDKIIEVFSFVYNKYKFIDNPSILRFKSNYNRYSGLNFLQNQIYDYGFEVGYYIKCWQIILNNFDLFENIFNKYLKIKEPTINTNTQPQQINNAIRLISTIFFNEASFESFNNYLKLHIVEPYVDFSYLFQRLLKGNMIVKTTHLDFVNWLFTNKYISEKIKDLILENNGFRSLSKSCSTQRENNFNKVFNL